MDNRTNILKELETIEEVPTLPQVAFKLIALISDESSSMREIGNLIEEDPPLVAKILRIVNSGYYNLRKQVTDIRQAVVFLGIEEIRNLVFALSVFSTFYHIKENQNFSFLQFWKHSASTAKMAAALAKFLNLPIAQSVFINGLLHDFGRLILQLYFQEEYNQVFEYAHSSQCSLLTAERKVLDFGHNEAGAWLAEFWNLPAEVTHAINHHHDISPAEVEEDIETALVNVADKIANIWGVGVEPNPTMMLIETDPLWLALQEAHPRLQKFPLDEMTRIFDMHMEEAETFVTQIVQQHELLEATK
ncbi:MAG: hypothetical protein Kow0037_17040 [Calditrichia bacterium]